MSHHCAQGFFIFLTLHPQQLLWGQEPISELRSGPPPEATANNCVSCLDTVTSFAKEWLRFGIFAKYIHHCKPALRRSTLCFTRKIAQLIGRQLSVSTST